MLQRIICHPPSFFAPPSKLQRPQNTIQCIKSSTKQDAHRLLRGLASIHPLSNQVGEGLISGRDPLTFFCSFPFPSTLSSFCPRPMAPWGNIRRARRRVGLVAKNSMEIVNSESAAAASTNSVRTFVSRATLVGGLACCGERVRRFF